MVTKDIMLKIIGKQITADMEEEALEFVTEGKLYKEGDTLCLLYDESEFSGMLGCQTTLRLNDNMIKMKRIGAGIGMDTVIEFRKGERYCGYYDTPFGAIEMEVLTNELKNNLKTDGTGSVDIDYHISLKGLSEGRNKLNIQIM